jgi:orotate phosphoribosyltransferase
MQDFQRAFVDHLVRFQALRFGDFTLKSGRKSPYFINAGQMRTGQAMSGMGRAYAAAIRRTGLTCDLVFGPAYKGIPLAVATAIAMSEDGHGDAPFAFDRKEAKDHGEGGVFVGTTPSDGMHVFLVDDVITSGISIRDSIELLRKHADVKVSGVVVAVDRQERGQNPAKSTLNELQEELGLCVAPIVTIREIVDYLHGRRVDGKVVIDDAIRAAIEAYLADSGPKSASV